MAADPEYLRQHYASLSDEALLAIDRAELVDTARRCLDEEFGRRELGGRHNVRRTEPRPVVHRPEEPDWHEDASEVYSRVYSQKKDPGPDIINARDALAAAGIPCILDEAVIPEEKSVPEQHQWRVLVPGKLNMYAASILDRDLFNPDIEANWKTLLETLSDEEVLEMDPEEVFCGLFDRIERVTRAYDEEIARRKLTS
jgi:hypothetical protein